jgi:hypothetical protein
MDIMLLLNVKVKGAEPFKEVIFALGTHTTD